MTFLTVSESLDAEFEDEDSTFPSEEELHDALDRQRERLTEICRLEREALERAKGAAALRATD